MILREDHLDSLETHWAVSSVRAEDRRRAQDVANARLVHQAIGAQLHLDLVDRPVDTEAIDRLATAYEVAATEGLDALLHQSPERELLAIQAQAGAFRAFELQRVLPIPTEDTERILHILHLAALAYAGDRWADLKRWLNDHKEEVVPPHTGDVPWDRRVLFRVYDAWLRLFRKDSWDDLHSIAEIVAGLRGEQKQYEAGLLTSSDYAESQILALRLVALYHWAHSTAQLSTYMLQGQPGGITQELDLHFEKAIQAAAACGDFSLEMLLRWLHVAGRRMVAGSLWAATAGINSRVSRFVKSLTSSARPMIELLPPQRAALAEQGLLDPASRAVVVDLPTSAGKTTLAQFRILQALNQFSEDRGWVAYVAPTRALVAQLLRRLRRDFGPAIRVEQVSGAIEIDSFEEDLFAADQSFDVLIATPEKLSLIIRNAKLSHRPLALVVVDEAHNIEDQERGLRLELLLATLRNECPDTNYLLLLPFVPHADALARWLHPETGKSISLGSTAWQPNERIVGLYRLVERKERGPRNRKLWGLEFETVATTPRTIHLHGSHGVGDDCPLDLSVSKARSLMKMTTAMAKVFSIRGTSIAIGDTIPHVWQMGRDAAENIGPPARLSEEIKLVQAFLTAEIGEDFELISLLQKRVAVHHAGLPDDVRSLVEWLAEESQLRVLCATTTIAQGINFPVSSLFLSRTEHPSKRGPIPMTPREFWNLAGRAGRIGQDSIGVVGIATNSEEKTEKLKEFVAKSTTELASRLLGLIDDIIGRTPQAQLAAVVNDAQWADFRSFVAHLLREANDLQRLQTQTEQLLRSTFGYSVLRSQADPESRARAEVLLDVTNAYAQRLSQTMNTLPLVDSTGFDPEGVRSAMSELRGLEQRLTTSDWEPQSLFGGGQSLASLVGIMMHLPNLKQALEEMATSGRSREQIAEIAKAWVTGRPLREIATEYFEGDNTTEQITEACRGIYRALLNSGVWGLAGLSKLPGSGIEWDKLTEADRKRLNLLPAFLYHGVDTEEAVLMRMNMVPRSMAKRLGVVMRRDLGTSRTITVGEARDFVRSLTPDDWLRARPQRSTLSGEQYRQIWQQLSGEHL